MKKEALFLQELLDLQYKSTTINNQQKSIVLYSDITNLINKYRKILFYEGYELSMIGELKEIKK